MAQPNNRIPASDNRRRASRIEKDFSVTMSTPTLGEQTIRARNVSAGGILVDVPAHLPPGTSVQITFTVPDTENRFVASGAVTEVRGQRATETSVAVRFDDVACL